MSRQGCVAAIADDAVYHGLLPREDIPSLLRENGDFILRLSEEDRVQDRSSSFDGADDAPRNRVLILSLFISPIPPGHKGDERVGGMYKHYKISEVGQTGRVTIDGHRDFASVNSLLARHMNGAPLTDTLHEGIIRNGVVRQKWELLHENIIREKKLGEGAFGEVCRGKLRVKGAYINVALKIAKATAMNKEKIKEVMKEARIMRNFDHPNVVKLYGVAVIKEPLMIVMELVTGGSLDEYLKKVETTVEQRTEMVMGAAWGVAYLHNKRVIHRDLAARNCLFNNGVCKISDFGLTREGTEYHVKIATKLPIRWLAPETIRSLLYSQKSDVWSFAVLVWEIYERGEEPYTGLKFAEVKEFVLNGNRLQLSADVPDNIKMIIRECWSADPFNRKTMRQIVNALERCTGMKEDVRESSSRERGETRESREGHNTSPPRSGEAPSPRQRRPRGPASHRPFKPSPNRKTRASVVKKNRPTRT